MERQRRHHFSDHRESNPHFLPRRNNDDPVIDFSLHPPPPHRPRPPPNTTVHPPYAPRPQPPLQADPPPHQSKPHFTPVTKPHFSPESGHHIPPESAAPQPLQMPYSPGRSTTAAAAAAHHHHRRRHHHQNNLRMPDAGRTTPIAWLVAAFCALFWLIVIIGGLIILIVYLFFRPRNPRFDISTATLNAAYLDQGYLLNADVTLLVNFTNPNTKVNIDFTYVVLDIFYDRRIIATGYIDPFSVHRRESRFADVHMVASQVTLSMGLSMELQRQIAAGRVNFEVRGLFKTRSRFGSFFRYTYWLYARCQIAVAGPPTGVLIGKRCITKR
ncbi:NDR1/HIN1-like protein 12 [Andrographis paniculata]|uniref:NDR1/HIN1-like protein 12 n=1 Tax=Andrographis paniculata TaxID=175694 RepID=UPI0021E86288|nr:NDR1/HIN1-like protein 12 [Andrographis paniculata]